MNEVWYSKEWDDAPMPHSIFFTKDGHAIHGSYEVKKLGKPVSHGCVRISPKNAATLYSLVAKNGIKNTQVVLTGFTPGGEGKVASSARSRPAKAATSARLKSRYVQVTPTPGLLPTTTGLLSATRILSTACPSPGGRNKFSEQDLVLQPLKSAKHITGKEHQIAEHEYREAGVEVRGCQRNVVN